MKLLTLTLMIFLASACGAKKKTDSPISPPGGGGTVRDGTAEFASYIDAFEDRMFASTAQTLPGNVDVQFTLSLASNILGTCAMVDVGGGNLEGTGRVRINQTLWDQIDKARREQLIFHELGHCVLDRLHDSSTVAGYPVSIMYPNSMTTSIYNRNQAAYSNYMAELFNDNSGTFAALSYSDATYASTLIDGFASHVAHGHDDESTVFECGDEILH